MRRKWLLSDFVVDFWASVRFRFCNLVRNKESTYWLPRPEHNSYTNRNLRRKRRHFAIRQFCNGRVCKAQMVRRILSWLQLWNRGTCKSLLSAFIGINCSTDGTSWEVFDGGAESEVREAESHRSDRELHAESTRKQKVCVQVKVRSRLSRRAKRGRVL